jgi:peptide deformylase
MSVLRRRQFGDPILRQQTRLVSPKEIASAEIQSLIADMRKTLQTNELGVGLAAPQIGHGIALAVIWIEPTAHRPDANKYSVVIINPVIIRTIGRKKQLWEGCISAGSHGTADLFAKVPRHQSIEIEYLDEHGNHHTEVVKGLIAHVMQHEVDHLNGMLFVDRVKDTSTYMTNSEYKKMLKVSAK